MEISNAFCYFLCLQLVSLLEGAIKRDCLSSSFETTNELLGSSTPGTTNISGSTPVLPWIPVSIAAVALRILDLDASISYTLHQRLEFNKEKETGDFIVSSFSPSLALPQLEILWINITQTSPGEKFDVVCCILFNCLSNLI